jgi:hypothetical protein
VSRVVDVYEISAVVAAAGVLVGVVYYILDMRHQRQVRQTDLVMRLYSTLGSKEFWEALTKFMMMEFEDYNDYKKKYVTSSTGWSEKPEFIALSQVAVFFDGIGVLLCMKLIDIDLAARLFRNSVVYTWEKVKPIIEGLRTEGYPQIMAEYENLYNEMKKREQ